MLFPIHFVHPWVLLWLWAPLLLWGVHAMARVLHRRRLVRFADGPMRERLLPPASGAPRGAVQLALCILGLMLAIVACARPQWGERRLPVRERSRNLMVLLDVSRSMLAEDVRPNRLERAKAELHDLVDALEGDRIGLIAFRNGATLVCPLTRDYGFFRFALDGVDLDAAPPGTTDIASGLVGALEALNPELDGHHAILLVSDGEQLTREVRDKAVEAARRGIPVFTLAIGSDTGAPVPDGLGGQMQHAGETVISRLELEVLQALADLTGGVCIPLGESGVLRGLSLAALYRQHLKHLAAADQAVALTQRRVDRQAWFLTPAALLLMGTALLSPGRRRRRTPPLAVLGVAALLFHGAVLGAGASTPAAGVQALEPEATEWAAAETPTEALRLLDAARAAFAAQRYRDAAQAYLAAAGALDARRGAVCRYNAALSLARAGDTEPALETLDRLQHAPHAPLRSEPLRGILQYQLGAQAAPEDHEGRIAHLDAAVEAFRRALPLLPDDPALPPALSAAIHGLRRARQDAHIDALMQRYGQTPPEDLLRQMLQQQRRVSRQAEAARDGTAPQRIAAAEAAAAQQAETRDLLIPLKPALLEAARQQGDADQAVWLDRQIESLRDQMDDTAQRLRDLDADAARQARDAEPALFNLWQPLAPPPPLVEMALVAQSNALYRPPPPHDDPRAWQLESEALTQAFAERFDAWADAWNADAASDDTRLSDEDRQEIDRLTQRVLALQALAREAIETDRPADPFQSESLAALARIHDLLPKPPSESQQDSQGEPPDEPPDESDEDRPSPDPPSSPDESPGDPPEATPEADALEDQLERLLELALRREQEHADEQRRRAREQPPKAGVRDW